MAGSELYFSLSFAGNAVNVCVSNVKILQTKQAISICNNEILRSNFFGSASENFVLSANEKDSVKQLWQITKLFSADFYVYGNDK